MAAILRLAGGLDRSRSQQVQDVHAKVDEGRAVVELVAADEPLVDIWGAERRTELFERVFGMPVSLRWAGTPESSRDGRSSRQSRKRRDSGGGAAASPGDA